MKFAQRVGGNVPTMKMRLSWNRKLTFPRRRKAELNNNLCFVRLSISLYQWLAVMGCFSFNINSYLRRATVLDMPSVIPELI